MWFVCQVKVTTGGMYTKMFIVFHYTWGCEWGFKEGNYRQKIKNTKNNQTNRKENDEVLEYME